MWLHCTLSLCKLPLPQIIGTLRAQTDRYVISGEPTIELSVPRPPHLDPSSLSCLFITLYCGAETAADKGKTPAGDDGSEEVGIAAGGPCEVSRS